MKDFIKIVSNKYHYNNIVYDVSLNIRFLL